MKKILSLVMVIVLALCLDGCGQIVSKADYYFSVQDFMMDCTFAHDKDPYHSWQKAEEIYKNKRIEISGKIWLKLEKNDNFGIIFGHPEDTKKLCSLEAGVWSLGVLVRDKNILDKLKEGDFVKMSGLFDGIRFKKDEATGRIHIGFHFIDGVLISKL